MFRSAAAAAAVRSRESLFDQQTQTRLMPCLGPRRRTSGVKVSLWVPPKEMQNFCIFESDAKLLRRTLDHSNFSCKSMTDCVRFSRAAFLPIDRANQHRNLALT